MLIKTKRDYFALARVGLAGNAPLTWDSPVDFRASSLDEFVGIRVLAPGSAGFRAHVGRDDIEGVLGGLGLSAGDYVLSRSLPREAVRISGELGWYEGRWVFYHSFEQIPMREALARSGRHAFGEYQVWGLLSRYCTPADVVDLRELFAVYSEPGNYPVVELTVTFGAWGIFPRRNTLVWEVRHY